LAQGGPHGKLNLDLIIKMASACSEDRFFLPHWIRVSLASLLKERRSIWGQHVAHLGVVGSFGPEQVLIFFMYDDEPREILRPPALRIPS
jgi:hypothetical protein